MIDTSHANMPEIDEPITRSKSNPGEASTVLSVILRLSSLGISQSQIGIVTPYNAQATLIRNYMHAYYLKTGVNLT